MSIFNPLFIIFILPTGGYFTKRVGTLKQRRARTFLDFAIVFALPCLILDKAYHLNFDFSLIVLIFIGFSSCALTAFIVVFLGFIFNFSKATLVSMFLLSYFGNTTFVGMPIVEGIFANAQFGAGVMLCGALATTSPISLLGSFILSLGSGEKVSLVTNTKRILSLPPFLALLLGFLCKLTSLPELVFSPTRLFGGAATPVALFAMGLGLGFTAIKTAYKPTIPAILAKMALAPLIFVSLLKFFGFEMKASTIAAIIESTTPIMTLAGAMVMKAKLDSNLAISTVAFGVFFAFTSMPILVWALA